MRCTSRIINLFLWQSLFICNFVKILYKLQFGNNSQSLIKIKSFICSNDCELFPVLLFFFIIFIFIIIIPSLIYYLFIYLLFIVNFILLLFIINLTLIILMFLISYFLLLLFFYFLIILLIFAIRSSRVTCDDDQRINYIRKFFR